LVVVVITYLLLLKWLRGPAGLRLRVGGVANTAGLARQGSGLFRGLAATVLALLEWRFADGVPLTGFEVDHGLACAGAVAAQDRAGPSNGPRTSPRNRPSADRR
jgi:hypothetical protein